MVFKAPNTWAGQQGAENLVFHGVVDPRVQLHYGIGSAFYDSVESRFVIGANSTSSGGWSEATPFTYSDLLVGRSVDGTNFNDWRTVLWVNPEIDNIRIYNLSILPDPNRPGVWFGLFVYALREGGRGTARIEIHNDTSEVWVSKSSSGWKIYSFGDRMTETPYRITGATVDSFKKVTVDGVTSYEMWTMTGAPRSGQVPCSGGVATEIYTGNTSADTQGRKIVRYEYSPVYPYTLSGPYDLGSISRPMPTDYNAASISVVTRHDYGSREAIFSGTTDQRVCDLEDHHRNPWRGSSILFTRIYKQADGTFREEAATYFLNIKKPNWTCAPGTTTCYGEDMNAYAFVAAHPVVHDGNVYFYVQTWGSPIPS